MSPDALELSCACGSVQVRVARRPEFIHACNCTLCRKVGARWGYYAPTEVDVRGRTAGYVRTDKPGAAVEVHFGPACGATTHFRLTPEGVARHGDVQRGVNMGLADEATLAGVEVRYPDGLNWSGSGPFGYVRPPRVLG